ncbi:TlpA family protein disulfide reductase [Empedobacter stercoris]|uniref:TlpA family protein disulfide reductase n=1 Tax=Empedobacter stercoris TaxID=1628248 RepID=UPI001861C493|nr:TlpA disulfide reductase family protein [Empedobacter stercoris]QNT13476.1 TlpA family protein disulfide reductase [Empedobacter stercoris]
MLKRNYSTIIVGALALVLLFVPEAKAMMQKGLMKLGLFDPKLEKVEKSSQPETEANYIFEMVDVDGKAVNMEDLKGKVVFMNFWATWCPPCIAEMPSIQTLYDKVKDDKDIVILTVEVEGKRDKVAKFMERKKLSLPVVYPNSSIPTEFFNGSLPTTIILDKKGNIAHTTMGMADYSGQDIVDFLNELKTME